MNIEAARARLMEQHDRIRAHLSGCTALARLLRHSQPIHVAFGAALAELRSELIDHNATETNLIRPLLHDSPGWGTLLVDRMYEEHVAEHTAMWEMLVGTPDEVASRMDDLAEELDAHMAAEERTFLSPHVLRQDVITAHRRQEST